MIRKNESRVIIGTKQHQNLSSNWNCWINRRSAIHGNSKRFAENTHYIFYNRVCCCCSEILS